LSYVSDGVEIVGIFKDSRSVVPDPSSGVGLVRGMNGGILIPCKRSAFSAQVHARQLFSRWQPKCRLFSVVLDLMELTWE